MSTLVKANLLLLGLLALHTVDHAVGQSPRELPGSSSLVAAAGFALTSASTWLALHRWPHAAEAAAVVGALTAAGVVAIHLVPSWWAWVSDPYWDFPASFVNWLSLLALLASSLYLAGLGLRDQRHRRAEPSYRH